MYDERSICIKLQTERKLRIPFGDEYVPFYGHFEIGFQLWTMLYFLVIVSISCIHFDRILFPLFCRCGLYVIYIAHLGELRGDAAEIYTWSSGAIIENNNAIHNWKPILNGLGPFP